MRGSAAASSCASAVDLSRAVRHAPRSRAQSASAGDVAGSGATADLRGSDAAYRRRLAIRVAVCFALGSLLPGQGPPLVAPWAVASPSTFRVTTAVRLRGAIVQVRAEPPEGPATGAEKSDTEAELRARVAELELKLGEKAKQNSRQDAADSTPPRVLNSVVDQAFKQVLADMPELEQCDDARLGVMPDKQYVFQQGNASRENPIYKRKYEVLGMTLNQQEAYMKSFNRCVRKAKSLDSVKSLIELQKRGGGGLDRKQVTQEVERLKQRSRLATLFFRDIVPEVLDDPIANSITGLIATAGIVLLTLLMCFCFFPPIPPQE